jgi:N-acetylneuraminate lyase
LGVSIQKGLDMKFEKTDGLIAAPFTPYLPDGEINTEIIQDYAEKLKRDGLIGVFICGTTGEGMLLTNEERKTLAEKWVEYNSKEFKVIVHVGTTSSKQSKDLAMHAQKIGAYAIGSMGPLFLKPAKVEELVAYCADLASGAPELPFYYYHIPSISGVDLSMTEFIQGASIQIPNFRGIKYTYNNFMEMQQCLSMDDGKWDILHGFDELLLAGLALGAKGAVGSTYNYMAPLYNQIIADFENGQIDEAREKQATSVKVVEVLLKYGGSVVAGKALMKHVGLDCGPCRLPLKNLNEKSYKDLSNEIDSIIQTAYPDSHDSLSWIMWKK